MRTMSDFIMEQEISSSSTNVDVDIMEGFMKLTAIGSIAECYCEHAAIAEFSQESGLRVFSESDDNIMKKAWNATKEFFEKIWEWLKSVVRGVINFFTKSSVDRLIAKLTVLAEEGKFKDELDLTGIDYDKINPGTVLALVDEFSTAIKKGSEAATTEAMNDFIERAEKLLKKDDLKERFKQSDDKKMQINDVINMLREFSRRDIPSNGKKLLKKLDFDKTDYKKKGEDKEVDKDHVKKIKKAANLVAKAYDAYVSNTVKLVNKVLKKNLKEVDYKTRGNMENDIYDTLDTDKKVTNLAAKYGESYSENTDGYYFL